MTKPLPFRNRQPWRLDSRQAAIMQRISAMSFPPNWEDAACSISADPDLFFPQVRSSHNQQKQIRDAKRFCEQCIVKQQCLDYAMKNYIVHGIWGGMTPNERREFKKVRQWVIDDPYL